MELVEAVLRHFRHRFRIPLLAGPERPGDGALDPPAILRTVLAAGDARIVEGAALWLSLLDGPVVLAGEWSPEDRRRVAYLCEIARCLGILRGPAGTARPSGWARQVSGLEPATFPGRIELFESPAPPVPPSIFGDRWGVVEVLAFSDYAAFQRNYLDRLMDKLARGSATDWQDIEAIVLSPSCPEPEVVARQAAAVLADPPSSVFDPERFRANLERLATLCEGAGRRAPEP